MTLSLRGRRLYRAALLLPLAAAFSAPLSAQAPEPPRAAGTLSVRAGFALYSTGDDANCARAPSAVAGVQARTPGPWFVGVSGDVHVGLPIACGLVGTMVRYSDGRYADESGGVHFGIAPQVGVRAGRIVAVRGVELEPTLGAGGIHATRLFSDTDRLWMPWAGASLGVRRPGRRLGLDAEYSQHRVPMEHRIYSSYDAAGPEHLEIRRFGRWKPLFRLSLRASL